MLLLFSVVILIIAAAIIWTILFYIAKHPLSQFDLPSQAYAHEPYLDDQIRRVMVLIHSEEQINLAAIQYLLGITHEEAEIILEFMFDRGLVKALTDKPEYFGYNK